MKTQMRDASATAEDEAVEDPTAMDEVDEDTGDGAEDVSDDEVSGDVGEDDRELDDVPPRG